MLLSGPAAVLLPGPATAAATMAIGEINQNIVSAAGHCLAQGVIGRQSALSILSPLAWPLQADESS